MMTLNTLQLKSYIWSQQEK